jgi:hypothetical protein
MTLSPPLMSQLVCLGSCTAGGYVIALATVAAVSTELTIFVRLQIFRNSQDASFDAEELRTKLRARRFS